MREEEELANVERHLGERLAEARTHWAPYKLQAPEVPFAAARRILGVREVPTRPENGDSRSCRSPIGTKIGS